MSKSKIEEVENIHQNEANSQITSESGWGLPLDKLRARATRVAGNLSECPGRGVNFCNMLIRRKIPGIFPFPIKLHITKLFLTGLAFLCKQYGGLHFAGISSTQEKALGSVIERISSVAQG
jgi:hypothetical protein